jgi:hypothetical protein
MRATHGNYQKAYNVQVHLTTVVGSFVKVLPHMLAHYRDLGISSFLINVHLSYRDDPIIKEVERVTTEFGCCIASVTVGDWNLEQQKMADISRQRYPDDWFIYADQDELQIYPYDLFEIIGHCDQKGYDYITGAFIDRIGPDGGFPEVTYERSLWSQFPLGGFITYPILGGYPKKVVAAKGHVALNLGQHRALNGRGCPVEKFFIQVHHFKWANGIVEHLKQRAEDQKKLNLPHWIESQKFISHYEKHNGKFDIRDPVLLITECHRDYKYWEYIRQIFTRLQYLPLKGLSKNCLTLAEPGTSDWEPYPGHFRQMIGLNLEYLLEFIHGNPQ